MYVIESNPIPLAYDLLNKEQTIILMGGWGVGGGGGGESA